MSRRVGLYGGTFNPIHHGHLIAARSVAEQLKLDRIVLIPSASPPHKQGDTLAPATDRLAMARLAVTGEPLFEVSDIELKRTGPSYTIDTVRAIRGEIGEDAAVFWIIGADSLPELATWSRVAQLVNDVTIVTAARPGWDPRSLDLSALRRAVGEAASDRLLSGCLTTPNVEISASEIRRRVAAGRSIRFLTPDNVVQYICERQIYRETDVAKTP